MSATKTSKDEASAENVENLRLSQLSSFGIVVNPQWSIPSLTPEDLFVIGLESASKCLDPNCATDASGKKHAAAAVTSYLEDNFSLERNVATENYKQALADLRSLPKKLPVDPKKRFDAISILVQILKGRMGVPDRLDYSVLTYPNEKTSRDLVTALLERLSDHQDRIRAIAASESASSISTSGGAQAAASRSRADVIAAAFSNLKAVTTQRPAPFAAPGPRRFLRYSNKALVALKKPDQVVATALHNNAVRRVAGVKMTAAAAAGEDPEWVVAASSDRLQKSKQKKKRQGDPSSSDLLFGSVADVAPRQAAEAERRASEMRAKLKHAEDNVAQMKLSVEEQARAREQEDAQLSAHLRELKAGIKLFKAQVRSAKEELEALEGQYVDMQGAQGAAEDAAREAELAAVVSRREVVDGVAAGGEEFLATLAGNLERLREEHAALMKDIDSKQIKLRKKYQAVRDKIASMGPSKKELLAQVQASCKLMAQECRQKLEEHEQLEQELERSKAKSQLKLDRAVLSRMIYDVTVRRHAKQEEHIQNVIAEIAQQEKRKNELSDAISSRYAQIESEMFIAAKTDATVRELFGPLVGLRGEYVTLVKRIEQRGKARKEAHDVETRLNKLLRFADPAMLSSAEQDLEMVTEALRSVQSDIDTLNSSSSGGGATSTVRPEDADAI